MKICRYQFFAGITLLAISIICGRLFLKTDDLFFRLVIGLAIGYTLVRGCFGFGGCFNRLYGNGSANLIKGGMLLFFFSAIVSAVVVGGDPTSFDLRINTINVALFLGGFMFGCGMAFSRACASGILPDLAESPSRAFITLVFFCVGFVLGYPVINSEWWILQPILSTSSYNGVYFPDLFKWDNANGYIGGIILTGVICFVVYKLADIYEKRRKQKGSYTPFPTEVLQENAKGEIFKKGSLFNKIFVSPWQLSTFAILMSLLYGILLWKTKVGWIAAAAYGTWGMQFANFVGVSSSMISSFTGVSEVEFLTPFFQNELSVQSLAIILGAFVAMLTSGRLVAYYKAEWKITFKDFALYATGGLIMGFGARLSNGCNAGALYTPIANMSLSGWLVFLSAFAGAIVGNKLKKLYYKK